MSLFPFGNGGGSLIDRGLREFRVARGNGRGVANWTVCVLSASPEGGVGCGAVRSGCLCRVEGFRGALGDL